MECDSEDHIEATPQLSLCYIALKEWECFEELLPDLGDKSPFRPFVESLAEFIRTKQITTGYVLGGPLVISDASIAVAFGN